MITLETSGPAHDLVVTAGNLVIIGDEDQIAQSIREALGFFSGEWFLNNTEGVPWFQEILVAHPNLDTIQAILINTVLSVPGVTQLNTFSFDFTPGNRTLSVTFQAKTTNGQTINLSQTVGV